VRNPTLSGCIVSGASRSGYPAIFAPSVTEHEDCFHRTVHYFTLNRYARAHTLAMAMPMIEAFAFGPFRLLVEQRKLLAHGVPMAIGRRAFEILLLLVRRHGHLVTKDELMEEVWPAVVVEENNIQVHVSALRKALSGAGDSERYVLTIPGRGYCFVAPVQHEPAEQPKA
jgi:DNA-binding winged helix-turn-helix (wHTH) protein